MLLDAWAQALWGSACLRYPQFATDPWCNIDLTMLPGRHGRLRSRSPRRVGPDQETIAAR